MLVCHIITGLGSGGAERMLTRIATRAARGDAAQLVISLGDEGVYGADLRAAGVDVATLGMTRGAPSPAAFARAAGLLRRRKPDVVMSWLYHADLVALLGAMSAGLSPLRVIWNLRCSNIDFERYGPWTRRTVRALARLSRLPAVVAYNAHAGRDHHERLGYRPRDWRYLPNGVDLARWRPRAEADRAAARAELGLPAEGVLIGMVARVDPQKDHATFLAAAERVAAARAEARFVLIGEGTEALAEEATRNGGALAGRLHALGLRRDMPELAPRLDLQALSSAYGEGFPNVLCEAMACGTPCVATDVGDARRLIGDTGRVAAPRDPAALAEAMLALLDEPAEARRARGRAAREKIEKSFEISRVSDLYDALWRETARRRRGRGG